MCKTLGTALLAKFKCVKSGTCGVPHAHFFLGRGKLFREPFYNYRRKMVRTYRRQTLAMKRIILQRISSIISNFQHLGLKLSKDLLT
jgi:hypothetical protein